MLEGVKTRQFAGIALAHEHQISLRRDAYGNTTGLTGPSINVFHQNNENRVIGYHRWMHGGVHDDVIVITNFSDKRFKSYKLTWPVAGTWQIRFNSSWKGYSPDFNETEQSSVTTDSDRCVSIELADYSVIILSQDERFKLTMISDIDQ